MSARIASKLSVLLSATALVLAVAPGLAAAQEDARESARERAATQAETKDFYNKLTQSNLTEVRLGELALFKSDNEEIRELGRILIEDHLRLQEDMREQIGEGITLPSQVTGRTQKELNRLAKLSGERFDREFLDFMIQEHEKDISFLEQNARDLRSEEAVNFADRTIPILESHLERAEEIREQLGQ